MTQLIIPITLLHKMLKPYIVLGRIILISQVMTQGSLLYSNNFKTVSQMVNLKAIIL